MKSHLLTLLSSTLLAGCCSGLECEDDPRAAFMEQAIEKWCDEYQECFDDFNCDDIIGFDGGFTDCSFNIELAQSCLDGEYTCEPSTDYEGVIGPEACDEVFSCVDG
jgi:hypothetical protein